MKTILLPPVALLFMFIFGSCDNTTTTKDIDYQLLATDASIMETLSEDVFKVVDEETRLGTQSGSVGKVFDGTYQSSTCATVTIQTTNGSFPIDMTIDFGSGCSAIDGINRKGIITANFSGRYSNQGTVVTVGYQNYFAQGYQIEGSKTITNSGRNTDGNLTFSVEDKNGVITKPGGGNISWTSSRTHEWIAGESTNGFLQFCDDVYSISGTASGEASDGTPYMLSTSVPVKKNVCCPFLIEGTIDYEIDGTIAGSVNYGSGTCDGNVTVNLDGNTFDIIVQ